MSFVSQTVAGLLRNSADKNRKENKCDHCENYLCQRHHCSGAQLNQPDYKDYITLLQQCSVDTTTNNNKSDSTTATESSVESVLQSIEQSD